MPLRLFGGRGSDKGRTCPACEQEVETKATFCPSCFMVFRPEGAADLREHLRGGRIPSDVYLLRKMQVGDPDTGPVVRVSAGLAIPTPGEPPAAGPVAPTDLPAAVIPTEPAVPQPNPGTSSPAVEPQVTALVPVVTSASGYPASSETPEAIATPPAAIAAPATEAGPPPRARIRASFQLFWEFHAPLPPPACSIEEVPALFGWMLEQDPIIPNNLERLQEIHACVFKGKPAGRLEYAQHILLQFADDLALHPTRNALEHHLRNLATGYRRAAGAYHAAARRGEQEADVALWHMASMVSRLRVEAWIYQSRHGVPPAIAERRQPRSGRKATGD